MPKSSLSDLTTKRIKEPFDPALDAPSALTPDEIEKVAGGFYCGPGLWFANRIFEAQRECLLNDKC